MPSLVPFLREEDLRRRVVAFLARHHPDGTIPVPIEEIVEHGLGLDIVPTPGLLSGQRGINGFLTADRKSIYVDEGLFQNIENRYLFTLAHEVGHLELHATLYRGSRSEDEWKVLHREIVAHSLYSAEYQANKFAGLVLVPEGLLVPVAEAAFKELAAEVRASEPGFDLTSEAFWSYVAEYVGRTFRVSAATARIRLADDGLWRQSL